MQSVPGTIVGPGLDLRRDVVGKIRVGRRRVLTDPSTEPAAALSCVYNPDRNPSVSLRLYANMYPMAEQSCAASQLTAVSQYPAASSWGVSLPESTDTKTAPCRYAPFCPVRRLGRLWPGSIPCSIGRPLSRLRRTPGFPPSGPRCRPWLPGCIRRMNRSGRAAPRSTGRR